MITIILAGESRKEAEFKSPKATLELLGKPLIEYIFENIERLFPSSKKVVVGDPEGEKHLKPLLGKDIDLKIQKRPMGTAHAVYVGIEDMSCEDENLLILYADTPLFRSETIHAMIEHHRITGADITFMSGITYEEYPYAVVYRDSDGNVIDIREHTKPEYGPPYEYSIGSYIFRVGTFKNLYKELIKKEVDEQLLPDILELAIKNKLKVEGYICLDESEYLGINTKEDLERAKDILLRREVLDLGLKEETFIKFGTGGWRAKIGSGFTLANVKKLTQAIAIYLKKNKIHKRPVIVGYDNRFLSDEAARTVTSVLAANNIKTILSRGSVPTPLVTFTVLDKKASAGLVVTASHNPYDYNGIKVETEEGLPSPVSVSNEIEEIANNITHVAWVPYNIGIEKGFIKVEDYRNKYLDYLEEKLDYNAIKEASLRVCFDSMYGSGTTTIQKALIGARCDLELIRGGRDALFGGLAPAPTLSRLSYLISEMKKGEFDVGMAVDGDADRIVLVDEMGNFLHTNTVIALLWYYLYKVKGERGGVVRNIATSHNIDRVCKAFSESVYEVPVGFKHIAEGMIKYNALVGGESSGGITFKGHIMEKDGVYAAMLVVEMLAKTKKKLSELVYEVKNLAGKWYQFFEENIYLSPQVKVSATRYLESSPKTIGGFFVERLNTMDGYKFLLEDDRWVLLRFSGTEPVLRIMGEARDQNEISSILYGIKNSIKVK